MIDNAYLLDVVPGGVPVVVHVHQSEVAAREIVLRLYSRNGSLEVPSGSSAYIEGLKPDGTAFSYSAQIQGNDVSSEVKSQMVVLPGDVYCQCKVVKDGKVLIAANFIMRVEIDYMAGVPQSDTEIPGLVTQAQEAAAAAAAAATEIDASWFINGANNTQIDTIHVAGGTVVGALNELYMIRGEATETSFNDILRFGWYYINPSITTAGNPAGNKAGFLEVLKATISTYTMQRFTTSDDRAVYCRIYGAGAWTEWTQIGGLGGESYTLNSIAPAGSLNRVVDAGIWFLSDQNSYNQLPSGLSANPECIMEVVKANTNSSAIEQRLYAIENGKTYTRSTANGGTSWTTWLELGKVEVEAISDTASEYSYKGIRVKGRKYGNVAFISIFGTASENLGGMMSYLNLCELPEGWQSIIDPQQNHLINVSNAIWGTVSVFGRTVRLGWFRKLDNGTWAQSNVDQGTQLITSFCYICSG